jgi:hypothetical protein
VVSRPRRGRLPWLIAALALLGALWALQARKPPPPAETPPVVRHAAAALPPPRKLARATPPAPRELLLAALRSKAAELKTCPAAADALHQIPTRLDLTRAGTVRAVSFDNTDPLPHELAECVRAKILDWKLDDIELAADLTALVTLELR